MDGLSADAAQIERGSSIEERAVNPHPLDLSNREVLRELIFGRGPVRRNPRAIIRCLIAHLYFECGLDAKTIAAIIVSRSLNPYDLYGETSTQSVEQYVHRIRRRHAEICKRRGVVIEETTKPQSALDKHQFELKFRMPGRANWSVAHGDIERAFIDGDAEAVASINEGERIRQEALAELGKAPLGGFAPVSLRQRNANWPWCVPMETIRESVGECCTPAREVDQESDWLLEAQGKDFKTKAGRQRKKLKKSTKKAPIICSSPSKFVSLRAISGELLAFPSPVVIESHLSPL